MPDDLKDLLDYSTVLVICRAEGMVNNNAKIVKELLEKHEHGVYITVNQPYAMLTKILQNHGIDTSRLFFVDCITKAASGKAERTENCLYLPSPESLTELSLSTMEVLQALKGQKKFVFIDSLGTFLLYNSAGSLSKFSHFLITKISLIGVDGIFMCIEEEMDEKLKAELQSFCEKTIELK